MAVKKCDDVTAAAEETAVEEEEAPSGPPRKRRRKTKKVKAPVYLGKSLKVVEKRLYDGIVEVGGWLAGNTYVGMGYIRQSRPSDIVDPFRAESRRFFSLDENEQMIYVNSDLGVGVKNASQNLTDAYGPPVFSTEALEDPQEDTTGTFKSYTQRFGIIGDNFYFTLSGQSSFGSPPVTLTDSEATNIWNALVLGPDHAVSSFNFERPTPLIEPETIFTDHYTNIIAPFSQEEIDRYLNNVNNPAYADIDPNYNFFIPGYEAAIKRKVVKEPSLPNLYTELTKENSVMQQQLSQLGNGLEYIRKAHQIQTTQGEPVTRKYKNIGFPSSQVESLLRGTDIDDLYSMNATLDLKTEKTGEFIVAAETAGMTDKLLKFVMHETYGMVNQLVAPQTGDQSIVTGLTTESTFTLSTEQVAVTNGQYQIKTQKSDQNLQITDIVARNIY